MKIKKFKKFERYMTFFERHYNFRKPYQVIIDGTFAQAALENQIQITDQITKYLSGPVKVVTTSCILKEVHELGLHAALQILKQFQTHKCRHTENPKPAKNCIKSMVRGKNDNYVVVTQDMMLRVALREMTGVPIMYLKGKAPLLEKPSEVSLKKVRKSDEKKLEVNSYQKEILNHLKGEQEEKKEEVKRKRRGPAGPNPLSCKKSKKPKTSIAKAPEVNLQKKKKRKRVKLPKHVKEELSRSSTNP